MPVQPRFLGPVPVQASREDIAATVQMLRRSGSAPKGLGGDRELGGRGSSKGFASRRLAGDDTSKNGSKNPSSPSAAAAQLVLSKANRR